MGEVGTQPTLVVLSSSPFLAGAAVLFVLLGSTAFSPLFFLGGVASSLFFGEILLSSLGWCRLLLSLWRSRSFLSPPSMYVSIKVGDTDRREESCTTPLTVEEAAPTHLSQEEEETSTTQN